MDIANMALDNPFYIDSKHSIRKGTQPCATWHISKSFEMEELIHSLNSIKDKNSMVTISYRNLDLLLLILWR